MEYWLPIIYMGVGLLLVSIATPLVSAEIAARWFSWPNALWLAPVPLLSLLAFATLVYVLRRDDLLERGRGWILFVATIAICLLASLGLAYSLFPDIVIGQLTIWEASASVKSLQFALVGVVVTLPLILFYTVFVYRVFHGKVTALTYE